MILVQAGGESRDLGRESSRFLALLGMTNSLALEMTNTSALNLAVQELAEDSGGLGGLLPGGVMSSFGDHAHLASLNVLVHEFGFVQAGEDVFVPGDYECGNIDGFQCFDRVGTRGHAALDLRDG